MEQKDRSIRYFYRDKKYWYIGFPYNQDFVRQIKEFNGASWNPQNFEWSIPYSLPTINPLMKWLQENNFTEGVHYSPSKRVLEGE